VRSHPNRESYQNQPFKANRIATDMRKARGEYDALGAGPGRAFNINMIRV